MNFEEAFKDLNSIYNTYKLKKTTLIGFSFGGLITALYAEKYTNKIHSIILVSALLSQQESYDTMLNSLEAIYSNQKDSVRLKDILTIREMDKNSIDYRSKCFSYASENGFFSLKNPDETARLIYATYNTDSLITKYIKNKYAVETFWKNEKSINIDITPKLENLKSRNINIYGLYGQEDGLYSKEQINRLADLIGCNNLKYLPNCSHTVFVDQQKQFLESISTWLK